MRYEGASKEGPRHQVIKTWKSPWRLQLGAGAAHWLELRLTLICDWSQRQKFPRHPKLVALALFAGATA